VSSANEVEGSRSLALSFSRVAAARRIPVLPLEQDRNCHYDLQSSIRSLAHWLHDRATASFRRSLARSLQDRATASERSLARSVTGEGKRRGGCWPFCNRHDARVRVQRGLVSRVGFSVNF
jgi:hypothetical protein